MNKNLTLPPTGRVLLHVCCGPCSLMCIKHLRGEGLEPTAFFFNPNIHPEEEYGKRREAMRQVGEILHLPVIFEPALETPENEAVQPLTWCRSLKDTVPPCLSDYADRDPAELATLFPLPEGMEKEEGARYPAEAWPPNPLQEGVRCVRCYRVRMEAAAKLAKEQGFAAFTTSLLYSKYQHHELIIAEAERAAQMYGIPFLYRDFRVYWQEGIDYSKELGIYRQKWCGCAFSAAEAEAWKRRREERRAAIRAARRAEHEANAARKRGRRTPKSRRSGEEGPEELRQTGACAESC